MCPFQCQPFKQRRCPPVIADMLSKLKIECFYKQNGCPEELNYEALEQHELDCQYQLKQCRGCNQVLLRKEIEEHENICDFIQIQCQLCGVTHQRQTPHQQIDCLLNRQIHLEDRVKQLEKENKSLKDENAFIMKIFQTKFGIQNP
ncbi:unnamed protein product [Didymodactylos carnosus]|uniref:TNF receptor-associated factor 6 n=1 Tax=Didymodactylos carnosus TaxID=1234261 RepID=A0A815DDM8_9BILA|nr:unnamed protein product [Didymodactylos carnosus]CAF4112117.1 unnamed protein product [Didymodactylos carnosus]